MVTFVGAGVGFDATVPVTLASADLAATGAAAVAARRDHVHGMPTLVSLTGAQTFSGGVKTFNSSILAIRNPADTFSYTIAGGAITANRTITLPLLTGDDVMVAEAFAATLTNKTLSAPIFAGAYSFGGTPTFGATMAGASTFSGAITLSAATGNSLVVDTSTFVVDASNNRVGIGIATPSIATCDIRGDGGALAQLGVRDTSGTGAAQIVLQSKNATVSDTIFGVASTAGSLITSGGLADAAVISRRGAFAIQFATNDVARMTIGAAGEMGFFGVSAVARPSAYTQTYATADKTHATPTVGADIGAFTDPPTAAQMATLRTFVNALKADHDDLAQLVNAIIDDQQAMGLFQ